MRREGLDGISDVIGYHASDACIFFFFFFNDTATTEIYTLSLHDALPISNCSQANSSGAYVNGVQYALNKLHAIPNVDRKSTRLNSSHGYISYAVFCLKKKKDYTNPSGTRPPHILSIPP